MNMCPVCGYDRLEFPPKDFSICACCGTEFGYDDRVLTHAQLTQKWVANNCPWFDYSETKPVGWNPYLQLLRAKLGYSVPLIQLDASFRKGASIREGASISAVSQIQEKPEELTLCIAG